jgi:uncharacterized heparinase superfamily protein
MMMTPNPAIPSRRTAVDYSLDAQILSDSGHYANAPDGKWPVWAQLLVIVGISALLWAGIISGIVALFG